MQNSWSPALAAAGRLCCSWGLQIWEIPVRSITKFIRAWRSHTLDGFVQDSDTCNQLQLFGRQQIGAAVGKATFWPAGGCKHCLLLRLCSWNCRVSCKRLLDGLSETSQTSVAPVWHCKNQNTPASWMNRLECLFITLKNHIVLFPPHPPFFKENNGSLEFYIHLRWSGCLQGSCKELACDLS